MLNPFATDAFSVVSLTKAINILPNSYGRIRELNLMPGRGVRSRSIVIEERNGVLNLLPTKAPGAPGTYAETAKRKVRSFVIPHIPHEDVILPQEYEEVRAFGTENEISTVASIMNDHLQTAKNKFAITLEYLRMGALKGIIMDADGSVLYNLYTEFGIPEKKINFELGTNANVQTKCFEVSRHIEDNLKGEVMTEVRALVSPEFFDKLISNESVKEVFKFHTTSVDRLGGDPRKNFNFAGIVFEEYRGIATDVNGVPKRFIEPGEGHCFPLGTLNSFETLFAPADFIETVNTLGIELYAKQAPRKFERGIDLHFQSNPLPVCYRPGLLVKIFSSN
ncbi:MAG: major capsid protein [Desulfobacterales bacterium]|nr:major capsid protein [Desulfobacterales bacterium]